MRRLLLIALLAWSTAAHAATPAPKPSIAGAWALAGKDGLAFVYMTLSLPHGAADRLTGVEAAGARRVEIVTGARNPKPTDALAIDGTAPLVMQARGTHLILHGLKSALKPGQSIGLTLHFEQAGDVPVTVQTRAHAPEYGMPGLPGGIKLD